MRAGRLVQGEYGAHVVAGFRPRQVGPGPVENGGVHVFHLAAV